MANAVSLDTVKEVIERLKEEGQVVEYIVFDTTAHPAKKVLSQGGLDEGTAAAALTTMLNTLGTALQPGERFKRLSVAYPDCIYYAQMVGEFQVCVFVPRMAI